MSSTSHLYESNRLPVATDFTNDFTQHLRKPVVWLHLLVLLLHLPFLLYYFSALIQQPHYQFFPIVLLFTGYFVYQKLNTEDLPYDFAIDSWLGNTLLLLALPFLLFSNLTFDVDLIIIGCFLVVASLFVRVRTQEGRRILGPIIFPLALIIRLPFGTDIKLIAILQRESSKFSSLILDTLGVVHARLGNVIDLPSRPEPMLVEEACSGVQSLFGLMFVALAWAVWNERNLTSGSLLFAAAIFWAGFGNVLRITVICLAEQWLGIDLVLDPGHTVLGYGCMLTSAALLISTDFLVLLMLGPKTFKRFGHLVRPINRTNPSSHAAMLFVCALVTVGCLSSLLPAIKLGPVRYATNWLTFGDTKKIPLDSIEIQDNTIRLRQPQQLREWHLVSAKEEERERNSDWGLYSSSWTLLPAQSEKSPSHFSCDYPFSGWHELSVCYRGNGWNITDNGKGRAIRTVSGFEDWPVVTVTLEKPTGEHALLVFSHFGDDGLPIRELDEDILGKGFLERSIIVLRKRWKKRYGPTRDGYQVQFFQTSDRPFSAVDIEETLAAYVELRAQIHGSYLSTNLDNHK